MSIVISILVFLRDEIFRFFSIALSVCSNITNKSGLILLIIGLILLSPFIPLFGQVNSINFTTQDGLPSPETYLVHEDADGFLWVCTDRGLSRYNGYEFENFSTKDGLAYNTVFDIFEDADHNLWITGYDGGITIYDFKEKKLKPFSKNDRLKVLSESATIRGIGFRNDYADIFVVTWGDNALSFRYHFKDSSIVEMRHEGVKEMEYENITLRRGVNIKTRIPGLGFVVKDKAGYLEKLDGPFELLRNKAVRTYEKEILLFDENGIIIIDKEGRHSYKIENVSSFLKDHNGSYWISTLSNGIHLIPSFDFHFLKKSEISSPSLGDKLNDIIVMDEVIYIGTKLGRVLELNPENFICKEVAKVDNTIINFSKAENKIFASLGYEISTDDFSTVYHPDLFNLLEIVPFGTGYVGYNHSYSLVILNEEKVKVQAYSKNLIDGSSRTLSVCPINEQEIFFSTFNGVFKLNRDQKIEDISEPFGLQNKTIREIINPAEDLLLFGSSGDGLIVRYLDTTLIISKEKGLSSNFVNDVICLDNVIWCATNQGISRIAFELKNGMFEIIDISNFTTTEGLGANYIAELTFSDNKIWALSNDGIVSFDKNINIERNESPKVSIEGLKVGDSLYTVGSIFEYDQNRVEIEYLAISIRKNTSGKFYRYKLIKDGNDNEWNYTDNRSVAFDELGAGQYEFNISCRVVNGNWSTPSTTYFEIKPYFFDQLWVRGSGLFSLCILIFSLYKLDLSRRKKRYLEKIEKANTTSRLNKLELDVLRGQMNPHFIYNALNSVQKFLLKEDKIGANNFISRLAKMLRSGLEYSRSPSISIEQEIDFLDNYLKIETQRFPNRFSYTISVDSNLDGIQVPPLMVQPLCENAIKHAFREEKVTIEIKISEAAEDTLSVIVSDNGVGYLNAVEKVNTSKSLGINILKKRLLVFAEKGFKVSCNFMYLNQTSKVGTKVKLVIPILK